MCTYGIKSIWNSNNRMMYIACLIPSHIHLAKVWILTIWLAKSSTACKTQCDVRNLTVSSLLLQVWPQTQSLHLKTWLFWVVGWAKNKHSLNNKGKVSCCSLPPHTLIKGAWGKYKNFITCECSTSWLTCVTKTIPQADWRVLQKLIRVSKSWLTCVTKTS